MDPAKAAYLETKDLVIVHRATSSGEYNSNAEERETWNNLNVPLLLGSVFLSRNNLWGWVPSATLTAVPDFTDHELIDPAHPMVAGLGTEMFSTPRNYNVMTESEVGNGHLVARAPTAGASIVVWEDPGGVPSLFHDGGVETHIHRRVLFAIHNYHEAPSWEDISDNGQALIAQAVAYAMHGEASAEEIPPRFSNFRPTSGTSLYFAPLGLHFRVATANPGGIPEGNITVVLNGTDITSALEISGTLEERMVSYDGLVFDTDYTAVIAARDAAGLENTVTLSFDTQRPFALPSSWAYPLDAAVTSAPGLRARVVQAHDGTTLANSAERAEAQLAGALIDPATDLPHDNWATPSDDNPDGSYNQAYINWNVDAEEFGPEQGNFRAPEIPDQFVPGVVWHNLNIAAEVLTYLELTPGRYVMGVNSDDGFVVYSGVDHRDLLAEDLGRYDGGRASADTLFQFEVETAGLYPFRLVWYQGGGAANLEWFTVDPETNEKTLINYRDNPNAVRAWREISAPNHPYISGTQPAPGARNVPVDTTFSVTLEDGGAMVQEESIQLAVNGQPVSPQVSTAAGVTTVNYAPAQPLEHNSTYSVLLSYTDTAGNQRTATYEFVTRFLPVEIPDASGSIFIVTDRPDLEEGTAGLAGFLRSIGYDVETNVGRDGENEYRMMDGEKAAYLETKDLVIVHRATISGEFNSDATERATWNNLNVPLILGSVFLSRNNLWGWAPSTDLTAVPEFTDHEFVDPGHPIVAGLGSEMFSTPRNYNVMTQTGVGNGHLVARAPTAGASIVVWEDPGGTPAFFQGNSGETHIHRRILFAIHNYHEAPAWEDISENGKALVAWAVAYAMHGPDQEPSTLSLGIGHSADNVIISWPATGSEDFVLQVTPSLSSPDWQPAAVEPVVSNGQRTVTLSATESARFYRLIRP
jgi:hypothetical protein